MRPVRPKGSRKPPNKSIRDERMVKVLKMISEGRWTIRRAARFAAVTYYEILEEMAEKGIDSGPDLKDLRKTVHGRHIKDPLTVLIGKKPRFRSPSLSRSSKNNRKTVIIGFSCPIVALSLENWPALSGLDGRSSFDLVSQQ